MTTLSEGAPTAPVRPGRRLRNMGLFLLSPFIGLYYAVLMPGKLIQLARAEFQASSAASQAVRRL